LSTHFPSIVAIAITIGTICPNLPLPRNGVAVCWQVFCSWVFRQYPVDIAKSNKMFAGAGGNPYRWPFPFTSAVAWKPLLQRSSDSGSRRQGGEAEEAR
jgi:hypothetical protein